MTNIYSVSAFAKLIGRKVKTLQKWDRDGILVAYRTPTNRRYYTHEQYLSYISEAVNAGDIHRYRQNVIYARVINNSYRKELNDQIKFLRNYSIDNGIPIHNVYSDIGSGLNYRRPSLLRLIEDCFEGSISTIYITNEDRFVRFGFSLISNILKKYADTDIIVVKHKVKSTKVDAVIDLVNTLNLVSKFEPELIKYKDIVVKDYNEYFTNL